VDRWPCVLSPILFLARALITWYWNELADTHLSQELRMQDYQQNRKTAGSNTFGQSAFSSTTQPTTTTNLFGQSAPQQPTNSIFGSFGNASANSANPGSAFSGLGQNPSPATGGFGTFNQPSQQPSQQPATSGFGSFGQPQQQQSTGLFGSSSAFGSQNKPLGGFGTCHNHCPSR
jgi:nuclear pore complex protein Nup98-Nup96